MAYNIYGFSVLSYANGFTLWHYISDDPVAELTLPGYFDRDMARPGDRVFAATRARGRVVGAADLLIVEHDGQLLALPLAATAAPIGAAVAA
jgi:hypothetical protein